jgi:hypothetical protein
MSVIANAMKVKSLGTPLTDHQVQMLLEMPFDPSLLSWKPQTVKENRCYPVVYVDARDVMDRLNWVVGPGNWETKYIPMYDKQSVQCDLTVVFPSGKTVTRSDVGSFSEQPDMGDKVKSAYSDSLKRAAVQFGIGAYFYGIKSEWVNFDQQKKRIPEEEINRLNATLPEFAKPSKIFGKRFALISFLQKLGLLSLLGGYKILLLEDSAYEQIAEEARKLYPASK